MNKPEAIRLRPMYCTMSGHIKEPQVVENFRPLHPSISHNHIVVFGT